jgi:hypothetical protein
VTTNPVAGQGCNTYLSGVPGADCFLFVRGAVTVSLVTPKQSAPCACCCSGRAEREIKCKLHFLAQIHDKLVVLSAYERLDFVEQPGTYLFFRQQGFFFNFLFCRGDRVCFCYRVV